MTLRVSNVQDLAGNMITEPYTATFTYSEPPCPAALFTGDLFGTATFTINNHSLYDLRLCIIDSFIFIYFYIPGWQTSASMLSTQ